MRTMFTVLFIISVVGLISPTTQYELYEEAEAAL